MEFPVVPLAFPRFPVSFLGDGHWHQVALSISLERLELHVDCRLLDRVSWANYFGMGVNTEGLIIIGGLIESSEIPFKVRAGQGLLSWVNEGEGSL